MLLKVTVAEETPVVPLRDEVPAEQGPDALKLTNCMFGELPDSAVAVTTVDCVLPRTTELGNGPRTMDCATVNTAGIDGALDLEEPFDSGTSVVAIV